MNPWLAAVESWVSPEPLLDPNTTCPLEVKQKTQILAELACVGGSAAFVKEQRANHTCQNKGSNALVMVLCQTSHQEPMLDLLCGST
eukprot:1663754-Ditylum_brightwellii.AAC.1